MIEHREGVKWPTLVALPLLILATVMNWYWVWGCLFLYWAWPALRSGEVYLVEPIRRAEDPLLFWAITALWAGLGVWAIVSDLSWRRA